VIRAASGTREGPTTRIFSLLEGNQIQGGAQLLYGNIGFTSNGKSTPSGGGGGNPVDVFPAASGFYVHSLGQDWKVGLGMFSNFGLGLKYTGEWVGRYYVKDALLAGRVADDCENTVFNVFALRVTWGGGA
jgi:hypothetical protein